MSRLLISKDTVSNQLSFYHLACFLVLLPFDYFYSELVLLSFGIHTLVNLKKRDLSLLWSKPLLVLISIYLLNFSGMLYSPDLKEAVNVSTRQLAILLFPLLFMLNRLELDLYKWSLLKIFGYTCTATILYLYADALHTILYFHMPATALFSIAFMNHNFSLPLELHATYLSMFAALSITVFLYLFQTETVFKKRFIYLVCMLVLLAGMIQLSSRAAFIALLIILNVVFPFSIYPLKKRLSFFLIMSVFSAGILITIFSVDAFKTRYITELKGDLGRQTLNAENTEPRITRWKIVFGLARQSPFVGYGSGSETALLKKKYFEQHLYISYLNEFNSHSQYLSFLLKYGLLGLGIFVYLLIFVTNDALKKKDIVFLGFLTLIMVVSVSENVLDLNKGIFFYSFFISLFLIPGYKEKRLNRQPAGNQISTGSVLI